MFTPALCFDCLCGASRFDCVVHIYFRLDPTTTTTVEQNMSAAAAVQPTHKRHITTNYSLYLVPKGKNK